MFNPYIQQQPFIPQQQQQPSPAFLQVPSAKDFASVTVQPGKQALIMAQNEPYMAFKTADMMGLVQTNVYKIEAVNPEKINNENNQEYVTKAEFYEFINSIKKGGTRNGKSAAASNEGE